MARLLDFLALPSWSTPALSIRKSNFRRWVAARLPAGRWAYVPRRGETGTRWSAGCGALLAPADRPDRGRSIRSLRFPAADPKRAELVPSEARQGMNFLRNAPTAAAPTRPSRRPQTAGREHRWHPPPHKIPRAAVAAASAASNKVVRPEEAGPQISVRQPRGRPPVSASIAAIPLETISGVGRAANREAGVMPASLESAEKAPEPMVGTTRCGGRAWAKSSASEGCGQLRPQILQNQKQKGGSGPPKWKPLRKT